MQIFILLQYVLPYVKYLLSMAYQYEREHKISEKFVSQGIETVDMVGKGATAVFDMGDGKVGKVVGNFIGWFVEGVTGGIHEGIGEGMAIMGARRPTSFPVEAG